jgi:arylsulfatase A
MILRRILLALAVLLTPGATPAAAADSKPNVIVFLADDLGYADVQCYGGKIPTPHIDRLAAEGMRFTDAHSTSSVCTPTRYGLLTGRYNWRSKLKRGVLGGLSPRLIEPERMTVAAMLTAQGYRTGCVGKWHLGMDWVVKPGAEVSEMNIEPRGQVFNVDYAQPIANGPNSVGFDYYYGISASLDMVPYTFIENDRVVSLPTEDRDFLMMHGREQGGRTRKGPTAPDFDAADVLPVIARKSSEFIDRCADDARAGKPFFLYVPFASPHTPILPTAPWQGKSGINPYADFVMETDAAVGEILAAVDRQQLTENTLVIFTSDNGCSPQAKFEELAVHGHLPSGPLRGHKADLFEADFACRSLHAGRARWRLARRVRRSSARPTSWPRWRRYSAGRCPTMPGKTVSVSWRRCAVPRGNAITWCRIRSTARSRSAAAIGSCCCARIRAAGARRGRAPNKPPVCRRCNCTIWPTTSASSRTCRTASPSGCGN